MSNVKSCNLLFRVLIIAGGVFLYPGLAVSDSTNFPIIKPGQVTPYYSGATTSVSSAYYFANDLGTLMPCPGDPSRTLNYTGWPTAPICPNINGTMSSADMAIALSGIGIQDPVSLILYSTNQAAMTAGTNPYCPDTCTVTRATQPATGNGPFSKIGQPICPPGYAQIDVYNMQPVIAYNPNSVPVPFPIPNLTTYYSYKNNPTLYNACPSVVGPRVTGNCAFASMTGFLPPNNYTGDYQFKDSNTGSVAYANNIPLSLSTSFGGSTTSNYGTLSTALPNNATSAVIFFNLDLSSTSYTQPWPGIGCGQSGSISMPGASCTNDTPSSKVVGQTCGYSVTFSFNTSVSFNYATCSAKPGWYTTSSFMPASTVCARIKPQWQK